MNDSLEKQQRELCRRVGAPFLKAPEDLKVGIADNVGTGITPINGLRHPPEGDTTGWYLWAGEELSNALGFYKPLCVSHLVERCPALMPYLGLAPGWRFLIDLEDHEDVWQDLSLLEI